MSIIHGVVEHNRYVYHYTKAATARDFILKDKTLLLDKFTRTNDPKESKDWQFNLGSKQNRDMGDYNMQEMSRWLSASLKADARLACFSLDRSPLSGDHTRDILSRGLAKPRMWAQYAEKHTGVCLIFDQAKLLKALREKIGSLPSFFGPVKYRDHYLVRALIDHEYMIDVDLLESIGPQSYVIAHLQQHHKALFFEKLLDWRDELEWRIVALSDSDADLYLPIETSLVGVIHGASIDQDMSNTIIELTNNSTVEHMGLIWANSTPWYDYRSLRWPTNRPRKD